jgi:hypothetical protein
LRRSPCQSDAHPAAGRAHREHLTHCRKHLSRVRLVGEALGDHGRRGAAPPARARRRRELAAAGSAVHQRTGSSRGLCGQQKGLRNYILSWTIGQRRVADWSDRGSRRRKASPSGGVPLRRLAAFRNSGIPRPATRHRCAIQVPSCAICVSPSAIVSFCETTVFGAGRSRGDCRVRSGGKWRSVGFASETFMSPDVVLGGMEGEQVAGGVDGRRIRHEKRAQSSTTRSRKPCNSRRWLRAPSQPKLAVLQY